MKAPAGTGIVMKNDCTVWVAVKELNLRNSLRKILLISININYGNLIYVP